MSIEGTSSDVAVWRTNAEMLVERIIEHGDDYGDLANTTADDLRDALRVAAEWLRHSRDLLVFADGAVLSNSMQFGEFDLALADLYAEDCAWAQDALRRAGCHPPRAARTRGGS